MKLQKSFYLAFFLFLVACQNLAPNSLNKTNSTLPSYDAELSNFPYPYPVRFFEFESQKQKLRMAYVLVEPQKPNGKTVLLFHGKNFASWYWDRTIKELSNKGFRVLAVDQVGFGKSSKPKNYQFSFHALAQNTKNLLEELQISNVVLIGHSMGGMLAVRFSLMFPETTNRMILINPIGLEDWKKTVPYRTVDQLYENELQQTPEKIREYQKTTYFAGEWKPEYEKLIEVASGWTLHRDYSIVAWNAALTTDMVFTQPVIYEFKNVKSPTLLVIGTRDRTAIGKDRVSGKVRSALGNYEVLGQKAAQAIPSARLVEIKDVGHMPQVEAFDAYISAIFSFL